jgi:hypothetical protein
MISPVEFVGVYLTAIEKTEKLDGHTKGHVAPVMRAGSRKAMRDSSPVDEQMQQQARNKRSSPLFTDASAVGGSQDELDDDSGRHTDRDRDSASISLSISASVVSDDSIPVQMPLQPKPSARREVSRGRSHRVSA